MGTFRFIIKDPSESVYRAAVLDASDIEEAKRLIQRRLIPRESVVSINAKQNYVWVILEGEAVSNDKIAKHSTTPIGVEYEGDAVEADAENLEKYRRPLSETAMQDRLNIRGGLAKALPSDRLNALNMIEKQFDGLFKKAKVFGWLLVGSVLVSALLAMVSGWFATVFLVFSLFTFGAPPLVAVAQKKRHDERKMIIADVRKELEANDGLLDGH